MRLIIRRSGDPERHDFYVEDPENATIGALRDHLEKAFSLRPSSQQLFLKDSKGLQAEHVLKDYDLRSGDILVLAQKLPPKPPREVTKCRRPPKKVLPPLPAYPPPGVTPRRRRRQLPPVPKMPIPAHCSPIEVNAPNGSKVSVAKEEKDVALAREELLPQEVASVAQEGPVQAKIKKSKYKRGASYGFIPESFDSVVDCEAAPTQNDGLSHGPSSTVCPMTGSVASLSGEPEAEPFVPSTRRTEAPVARENLRFVGQLGCGAFGSVTLQEDVTTGKGYALKALSKGYIARQQMQHAVRNERQILLMTDSPFIVRLLATYKGEQHVYFLLEAAYGGELFTTYEKLQIYGREPHARFYAACVIEAFQHLHGFNIVYRDLKPENLVLDAHGYCKLCDMGLAKIVVHKTFTKVGTPDYMPPEVFNGTGQTTLADWWALGVLIFELLAGHAPFEADEPAATYDLAERGIDAIEFEGFSADAKCVVKALCRPVPEDRLPAKGNIDALRSHSFFQAVDWQALQEQRLEAPYKPKVSGPRDVSNFPRAHDEESTPFLSYSLDDDDGVDWYADFGDSPRRQHVATA